MSLLIVDRSHVLRPAAEEEVRRIYRDAYGAAISGFPDLLAVQSGSDGAPECVAGVRFGLDESFCEQYLDEPVEALLARIAGVPVTRDRILEVTTLAGRRPPQSLQLLRQIIAVGRAKGMEWGLFTATRKLRSALPRLSLPLIPLAPARRERVSHPENWGRYYETDPWVCAMPDSPHVGRHAVIPTAGLAPSVDCVADMAL